MKMNLYDFYRNFYDLINLKINISDKKYLFLTYSIDGNYYFKENKFIETDKIGNILDQVKLLEDKYKFNVWHFYPVCYCNDTLVIALSLENSHILEKISYMNVPSKYRKLINHHRENYLRQGVSLRIKREINASNKYIKRYKFHNNFIKKYFLTKEKRKKIEFDNLLNNLIPNKKSIIDVSCGDSCDLFDVARRKKFKVVVGNDICLNYLNIQKSNHVIYTNDSILNTQFKKNAFDVCFCKNTLHHMNELEGINSMLDSLLELSDCIIIVEIEDPRLEEGLPNFLNKYLYTKFLKDVGTYYLDQKQFKKIINNKFKKHNIEYHNFNNILGNYMIAKITK